MQEVKDPIAEFERWLEAARAAGTDEPEAMAVATTDREGRVSVRMLLLKGVDARGFVFYTNLGSRKAAQLADNPRAALCFHWARVTRQVRVEGAVERVSEAEADAYFASRPWKSRVGAWASKQSQPLDGRLALERRVARFAARFATGNVPRPEWWSGFRLIPERIELWEQRPFRLHDRRVYERDGDGWRSTELFP